MIDYKASIDRERGCFIVNGPFDADAVPVGIPNDNPNRKHFVDLFLHKADIERGIDFLKCISVDKDATVNEGVIYCWLEQLHEVL